MSNSKPYWGKDGNHYSDIYEMQAANTRYEQREKLIEEQREANRLVREQNERIKNGGRTDSEIVSDNIQVGVLAYIASKNYQSEISNNIMVYIFIIYVVGIIVGVVLMTSNLSNYIPLEIGIIAIIHIYLKISIHIMERSIRNRQKKENIKSTISNNNELGRELFHEDNDVVKAETTKIDLFDECKEAIKPEALKLDTDKSITEKIDFKEYCFPSVMLLNDKDAQSNLITIKEVIETDDFQNKESKVNFILGKNDGNIVILDNKDIQHLLIIGNNELNKTNFVNTIITSIFYKAKPSEVKIVMIDAKAENLYIYDEIPYLLIPVVSDVPKANGVLAFLVQEMEQRYQIFNKNNVKNIKEYNAIKGENENILPYLLVIIDEFEELLLFKRDEIEESINRLLLRANNVGIHLIISTTNNIDESNINQTNLSRVLLQNTNDEESALVYLPNSKNPINIQNVCVSKKEIKSIVDFIKNIDRSRENEGKSNL